MKRLSLQILALILIVSVSSCCHRATAQEASDAAPAAASTTNKEWYYGRTTPQPATKTAGRQRAELRAQQRMSRMESMRWYGFSASRPTASGIPFTTMYSPQWTRPGGRPFAWYTSQRPTLRVLPYYASYYR